MDFPKLTLNAHYQVSFANVTSILHPLYLRASDRKLSETIRNCCEVKN